MLWKNFYKNLMPRQEGERGSIDLFPPRLLCCLKFNLKREEGQEEEALTINREKGILNFRAHSSAGRATGS